MVASKSPVHHILIIDDNTHDQFSLRRSINSVLPQVLAEWVHGDGATDYLQNCTIKPHLIFLNMNMENLPCDLIMEKIKANDNLNRLPVVGLTTDEEGLEKNKMMFLGISVFYGRSLGPQQITAIIDDVENKRLV